MEDAWAPGGSGPLPGGERDIPLCVSEDQPWSRPGAEASPEPGSPTSCSPSSPCSVQLHSPPGSAVSALQSKVKALSERRAAGKDREDRGPAGQASSVLLTGSKRAPPCVLGAPAAGKWLSSSSDEEMEPHSYLPNFPLPGDMEGVGEVGRGDGCEAGPFTGLLSLSRELGEGASLESLSDISCSFPEEPPSSTSWAPPRGFWKAARPETLLLNGDAESAGDRPPGGLAVGAGAQKKALRAGGRGVRREIQRSDSLEGHLRRCVPSEPGDPLGGLWRADSWESVCSGGSSLSLAERVEMNRGLLKQMLSKPRSKDPEGLEHKAEDTTQCNGRGLVALNDSDWDSGISLQDSEHSQRAFVLSDELPLSPRHEQAKRLLERARMKARSYPLKADHTILPVQRDPPEPSSRAAVPLRRAPLTGKEGAVVSGNLSDSSSGDSVCGPRRRHGQSPTRVRFEDESEKDAEVRYLERLRQRRRAGERAQGLLVSKPSLSSYVNGRRESDGSAAPEANRAPESAPLWNKKTRRTQERPAVNGGTHNKAVPQEVANRKGNSYGTVPEGASQTGCDRDSQGKTAPVWVAPDLPDCTVRTERIKETYIGEVDGPGDRDSGTEHAGGGGAGERASALGKLKRRSRKGDGRPEAGLSPYARTAAAGGCQETSACRPRRGGAEPRAMPPNPYGSEQGPGPASPASARALQPASLEASARPPAKDAPPTALPIKSALKSGPKNRPSGQRVVQLMPSPEYRLILLDAPEGPCGPEPGLPPGAPAELPRGPEALHQALEEQQCAASSYGEDNKPCPPGLSSPAPCTRPSALKHSPARGLSDHEGTESWDPATEEPAVGEHHQANGELCHDPVSGCSAPAAHCVNDGRIRGPMRVEHLREDSCELTHGVESHKRVVFEGLDQREGKPKLSLRRFFSAIGLNSLGKHSKGRSSSMEQLSFSPKSGPASPSPAHRHCGQLKKAPSLQSLRMGSPFAQLRKASSVQSLQIPKKKGDRSSAYMPGDQPCSPAYRGLPRALSVEDVGSPSAVRSVGRVAQAFPDGTLLLELRRPPNGPFGFLICRGKGRPDSGVYVEEMGDSSTQKLYAGLLGVGDEILEVNGEKVAGLTLDQVTRIMTQDCSTSIRVLRHRRAQR
ncbi:hypothetical protein COCON_G00067410 [Conger conger]|uniref:PDZ domain-containing protein n=1 Tax=Conger conger TaxID=82655 RepID=A0A9Q1DSL2_CONCO|nr:hypothetical protein COCON_G00067410 [Conger conger]